jgi:LPXTG-motif cell wall-anchored protein
MISKLVAFLTLAVLTLSIAGRAEAQPADYRTYFTFSAPVTLPGVTLPAGKYIFRLADPDSSRKVINVLSADGKRSLAMLHTIPNQAMRAPKDAEIRFMETSAKVPPPVKTWWYAGKAIGYEFIYPRKQALELAKATSEPILTTTKETTDFEAAELSRVNGNDQAAAVKVEQEPAPREASGRAQSADADSAQGGASTSANAARDTRADERARTTARTELPRTASSNPTVLMLGALALVLGLGVSLRSRARE